MMGVSRFEELRGRFENAVAAWDEHIQGCRGCLRQGNALCEDGYYLSGDMMQARAAMEATELRADALLHRATSPVGLPA
jgi:hypothetical protein